MKIAALGAHPDDIEIFMGGALFAWRLRGADLAFIVATDGAKGGAGEPAALAAARAKESEVAAALFGAQLTMLNLADGALHADATMAALLSAALRSIGPDLVVTHAPSDYHADHRALCAAARQAVGFAMPLLYCDTLMGTGFAPTHYVDITSHFETKCAAILCHKTQDPARFVKMQTLQNGFRAAQCGHAGTGYAEAYRFEPVYPFADIRDLLPPAPAVRPIVVRG